jgi:hypothetical protein
MAERFEFSEINETAALEWLNETDLTFRLSYSNHFWGSCNLVGRLMQDDTHVYVERSSVSIEDIQLKNGNPSVLYGIAVDFLTHVLHNRPNLFRTQRQCKPPTCLARSLELWRVIARRVRRVAFSSPSG